MVAREVLTRGQVEGRALRTSEKKQLDTGSLKDACACREGMDHASHLGRSLFVIIFHDEIPCFFLAAHGDSESGGVLSGEILILCSTNFGAVRVMTKGSKRFLSSP